jgi:peptidoglycan/xylan/chitin deacetylase (PgdA/CDA1 family)
MRLLSPILQQVVYPLFGRIGYLHSFASSPVSVVTYHGVLPDGYQVTDPFLDDTLVGIASFRSQLRLLKKHYNVISPEHFLGWLREQEELPSRSVLLTCDDGLLNNLTVMLPILREEGLQCLFFLTSASLGDASAMLWYVELYLMLMESVGNYPPVDWRGIRIPGVAIDRDERRACWLQLVKTLSRFDAESRRALLGEAVGWWGLDRAWKSKYLDDPLLRQRFQVLQLPELQELAAAGMTIGAHTMSHPVLAEQRAELSQSEIADCRESLGRCSGQTVWAIAYPFGDPAAVGVREYGFAEAAGYECAFVNVGGAWQASASRFSLPRIHITANMSLPVYEAYVSGFHDRLRRKLESMRAERNGGR